MLHSIILLRHGESADKQANQTDFERQLTVRGTESIQRLGLYLKDENIFPDAIVSSNAVRTVQTTRTLSAAMGIPESSLLFEPSLYNSTDEEYLKCISRNEKQVGLLMVVGHNPAISSVIGKLTGQYSIALHPGQAALVELVNIDLLLKRLEGKLNRTIGPFVK